MATEDLKELKHRISTQMTHHEDRKKLFRALLETVHNARTTKERQKRKELLKQCLYLADKIFVIDRQISETEATIKNEFEGKSKRFSKIDNDDLKLLEEIIRLLGWRIQGVRDMALMYI